MIKTRGLTKIFRTEDVETTPLREIDLEIEKGDFVSVMGPSGCGKSTLLHILGLLDSPSAGEYQLLGEEVSNCSERQRSALRKRNIGFVFQSFNLIDELTVFDNVELPLVYQRVAANQRRQTGRGAARAARARPTAQPLPTAALRRPAAAGRSGESDGQRPTADPGR